MEEAKYKKIFIDICEKDPSIFLVAAGQMKHILEYKLEGLAQVVINQAEHGKGCFTIRDERRRIFFALSYMVAPYSLLKDLDFGIVANSIAATLRHEKRTIIIETSNSGPSVLALWAEEVKKGLVQSEIGDTLEVKIEIGDTLRVKSRGSGVFTGFSI